MLAIGDIMIRLDGNVAVLRPTLRAAIRVHREFGDFDKAIEAIEGESITAMAIVIRESSTDHNSVASTLDAFAAMSLHSAIASLKGPLIEHVLRLAGYDDAATSEPSPSAKLTTHAERHAHLFQLATGWLGWSPEATYAATPSEIIEAYKGRIDLVSTVLKAVFGDSSDKEPEVEQSDEIFNSKLSAALAFASARCASESAN